MSDDPLHVPRPLRGKVVLIAGGSGGIGAATARTLGISGARVALVARDRERLKRTRESLENSGLPAEQLLVLEADLAEPESGATVVAATLERWGSLDVLINAAGGGVFKPFPQMSLQELITVVEGNLFAAMFLTHHATPALMRSRGHIIQLGSGLGRRAVSGATAYCAAKFGLRAFSESLRLDLARYGVAVTHLAPAGAGVDTAFWDTADPRVKRTGMLPPERVAEVVLAVLTAPDRTLLDDITLRTRP